MSKAKRIIRVWWIAQVGYSPTMYVPVENEIEAKKILDTLSVYDMFQYKNKIKGDYANAGGVEIFEDGEWRDWYIDDEYGFYDDIEEYLQKVFGIEYNMVYKVNIDNI